MVGALNSIFYPFFPQYPNLTYFWTLYFLHKRKFDQNLKELCFRSSLFFNSWGSELLFVKNKGKKGKVLNATAQRRTHTSLVNSPNQSPEPIKCQSLLLSVLMIGQPTFADAQRKLEGSRRQWRLHLNQQPSQVRYCMLLRDSALPIKIYPVQHQWSPTKVLIKKNLNLPSKMD